MVEIEANLIASTASSRPEGRAVGVHFHNPAVSAEFLASTDVVDWYHADVRTLAWYLAGGETDPVEVARRCFEWVRDEIRHSLDAGDTTVTCSASDVLTQRTGFCYAKSHLLVALLRANGIPAGFCYQRLSVAGAGPPFCLHGLSAALLPVHGWYRMDPRGNKSGINAQFTPPHEQLAFHNLCPGELTLREIYAEPLPVVVDTLGRHPTVTEVSENLPDWSGEARCGGLLVSAGEKSGWLHENFPSENRP
jgi:transglutaminase-like putative cysteine protease